MHRFWSAYSGPLIETLKPRRLLEVGAEFGWNTRHVLEYCRREGAHLDVVDTMPLKSLKDTLAPYTPAEYTLHACKSLEAIPKIAPVDFVLLDGDHNWRTVFDELVSLYAAASRAGVAPPVVIAHDCAWPYARRDMYYAPEDFAEVQRKPYAYRPVRPGESALVDEGLNGHFANALEEGGSENGVLTAIEDFVAARQGVTLRVLPFFNGLGIVTPDARRTPDLDRLLDSFFAPDQLLDACRALEKDGMMVRIALASAERLLTRRTDALVRARSILKANAARIVDLEARLVARGEKAHS